MSETNPEADTADLAEQNQPPADEENSWPEEIPLEADPADAADQGRTVELDEDDYR